MTDAFDGLAEMIREQPGLSLALLIWCIVMWAIAIGVLERNSKRQKRERERAEKAKEDLRNR
jgi:hypothetical protein